MQSLVTALQDPDMDPNMTNRLGETAILLAAHEGHDQCVAVLLKDSRLIPDKSDLKGVTALIDAALFGHASVVTLLLADQRVNPNEFDKEGNTALIDAAHEGHSSVVKLLLADKRVNENVRNQFGSTALTYAALNGHASVVTLLLADKRVHPNIADIEGDTALINAAREGHPSVVELLLAKRKVDPNTVNAQGTTALMAASSEGNASVVMQLVAKKRVDATLKNFSGSTAYDLAKENGHAGIASMLGGSSSDEEEEEDEGFDIPAPTSSGRGHAVEQIDEEGAVIAKFESAAEAERRLGCGHSSVGKVCRGSQQHTKGLYFRYADEDDDEDEDEDEDEENDRIDGRCKPVQQIDQRGVVVAEFKSAAEAARVLGCNGGSIASACRGSQSSAGGMQFRWADEGESNEEEEEEEEIEIINPRCKPVLQIDGNGAVVAEFKSVTEAARVLGCSQSHIGEVCRGILLQTSGIKFRWKARSAEGGSNTKKHPCAACGLVLASRSSLKRHEKYTCRKRTTVASSSSSSLPSRALRNGRGDARSTTPAGNWRSRGLDDEEEAEWRERYLRYREHDEQAKVDRRQRWLRRHEAAAAAVAAAVAAGSDAPRDATSGAATSSSKINTTTTTSARSSKRKATNVTDHDDDEEEEDDDDNDDDELGIERAAQRLRKVGRTSVRGGANTDTRSSPGEAASISSFSSSFSSSSSSSSSSSLPFLPFGSGGYLPTAPMSSSASSLLSTPFSSTSSVGVLQSCSSSSFSSSSSSTSSSSCCCSSSSSSSSTSSLSPASALSLHWASCTDTATVEALREALAAAAAENASLKRSLEVRTAERDAALVERDRAESHAETLDELVPPLEEMRREMKGLMLDSQRAMLEAGLPKRVKADRDVPFYYEHNSWQNQAEVPWNEAARRALTPAEGIHLLAAQRDDEARKRKSARR